MNIEKLNEKQLKQIRNSFTNYITKVIKHSAINFAKKEKVHKIKTISLNEYINIEMSFYGINNNDCEIQENVKYERLEDVMSNENHRKAVVKLSKREKQIIHLIYIEERGIKEISKMLNLTEKTILNTKNNALKKLRKDMIENEKNIR